MMYKQNFIVVIRDEDKKVLRESSEKEVFLPFDSNYSIRLKNNNNRKAVAEISIDGTDILGSHRIIVPAYGQVDVERFCLDGNLSKGKKLQFVRISDSRVQDPTSEENGIVRVRFWLEQEIKYTPPPIIIKPVQPYVDPFNPYPWDRWDYGPTWCDSSGANILRSAHNTVQCNSVQAASFNCSTPISGHEKGATVEGVVSKQSFSTGYVGLLEDCFTEIVLKLRPSAASKTVQNTKNKFCTECGSKSKFDSKFCHNCGNKF